MNQRSSKTPKQQEKYYEVDDIYEYMLSSYLNGNFYHVKRLYEELKVQYRKEFLLYICERNSYLFMGELLKALL